MSRSLSISLVAWLLLSYGAGALADASYPETLRLVRSMQEDELQTAAIRVRSTQQLKANKADERAACLVKLKYPDLTDAIALVISSDLSDAEVAEGIAFYRSLAGQKHIAQRFQSVTGQAPATSAAFTAQEQAAFDQFSKRSAGRKLLKDRIAQQKAVMKKIDERLQLAVSDCSYESEEDTGQSAIAYAKTCATVGIASPDNNCSVRQELVEYPGKAPETSIGVDCAGNGKGGILIRYKGKVDGITVKWLGNQVLEVSAPRGAVVSWMPRPEHFRVQLKEIPVGGKPLQCWSTARSSTGASKVGIDEFQSQLFWMDHGDADRCMLNKRMVTSHLPPGQAWMVQFLRVKSSALPFGTSQVVFFESFSTHVQTTSVRLRGAGAENLKLTPGGPQAGFHLIGAPAEELAKKIAAGGEVMLDVQPANDKAFSVPLTRTDFDWAHGRFVSCLSTL